MNEIHSSKKKFILVLIALLCSLVRMGLRIAFRGGVGSAAPSELNMLLSVCTQGFISGFALIPPWAMQECRAYGTQN